MNLELKDWCVCGCPIYYTQIWEPPVILRIEGPGRCTCAGGPWPPRMELICDDPDYPDPEEGIARIEALVENSCREWRRIIAGE